MPRALRAKSSTPRSLSSVLSRAVRAGCVRNSACAARLTFPVRATSTKDSRCVSSSDSGISLKFIARIQTRNWADGHVGTETANFPRMLEQHREAQMTELDERIAIERERAELLKKQMACGCPDRCDIDHDN